jgi:hypothetical protein
MTILNAQGTIYYGMHFYPGVAEYKEQGESFRVFLNENTIRKMDPTFAGRPIFVEHVDEVNGKPLEEQTAEDIRDATDGWVIESFYNQADGKHWVKFIICTDRGKKAIERGMRLSNAYMPKSFGGGGLWNGVEYAKEITDGEYDHLAIVRNPRYEESVIMTPEEFKQYNEDHLVELKRLSNSKDQKGTKMKFFKKEQMKNAADIEGVHVVLPKSGREVSITQLINEADEKAKQGNEGLADPSHKVKLHDGSYCNVAELVEKHKAMHDELEGMKKKKEDEVEKEGELETEEKGVDSESAKEMPENDDAPLDAEGDKEEAKEDKAMANDEMKKKNAADAKAKADKLRNAHKIVSAKDELHTIEFSSDQVARGKARYGSN